MEWFLNQAATCVLNGWRVMFFLLDLSGGFWKNICYLEQQQTVLSNFVLLLFSKSIATNKNINLVSFTGSTKVSACFDFFHQCFFPFSILVFFHKNCPSKGQYRKGNNNEFPSYTSLSRKLGKWSTMFYSFGHSHP